MQDDPPSRLPKNFSEMSDEMKVALIRRMGAGYAARNRERTEYLRRASVRQGQDLMRTGRFSRTDVRMMLRAQILRSEVDIPECDIDVGVMMEGEQPRVVGQLHVLPPDRLPAVPPNLLLCPLHERHQRGERYIPCGELYQWGIDSDGPFDAEWPRPATAEERAVQEEVRDMVKYEISPCRTLEAVSVFLVDALAYRAGEPPGPCLEGQPRRALPPLIEHGRLLVEHPPAGPPTGGQADEQLLYLVATRRIRGFDLNHLIWLHLPILDPGWLPCRHDLSRAYFYPEHDEPDSRAKDVPMSRLLCPLQVRGKQGDRTVPCVEALSERPDPTFVAADALKRKRGLLPGGPAEAPLCDEAGTPLPTAWQGEEDQPGGPADPVRLLQMRPCYLLGRMLYGMLPAVLEPASDSSRGSTAPAPAAGR